MIHPLEREIAEKVVDAFLAANRLVSVFDGEEYPVKRSRDKAAIMEALGSTDADALVVRDADGKRLGQVVLIWGNDIDLVSDWTDAPAINDVLEPILN